jgi:hypothetical protein
MESSKGEQASVVFLGRDTFRMRVVSEAVAEDGAIPTALSEGQTGRIFDRRRVPRSGPRAAEELAPARARRIPVFMLFTTVAAVVFLAAAVLVVRTHPTVSVAAPAVAPRPVAMPPAAPAVPAPLDEPTPAAMAPPVGASGPAPLDEPTPAAMVSVPTVEGPAQEAAPKSEASTGDRPAPRRQVRPARAARPAKRIVPPSRPWLDPFAG